MNSEARNVRIALGALGVAVVLGVVLTLDSGSEEAQAVAEDVHVTVPTSRTGPAARSPQSAPDGKRRESGGSSPLVTVIVKDADTGASVPNAAAYECPPKAMSVSLTGTPLARSNEFGVLQLAPRASRIIVTHPAYISEVAQLGESGGELIVRLHVGHSLTARLYFGGGKPVQGARVILSDDILSMPAGFRDALTAHPHAKNRIWCAITDAAGIATIQGLFPGTYHLNCVGPTSCMSRAALTRVVVPGSGPLQVEMQSMYGIVVSLPPEDVIGGHELVWWHWDTSELGMSRNPCSSVRRLKLMKDLEKKNPGCISFVTGLDSASGNTPIAVKALSNRGSTYRLSWTLVPIDQIHGPIPMDRVSTSSYRRLKVLVSSDGKQFDGVPLWLCHEDGAVPVRSGQEAIVPCREYFIRRPVQMSGPADKALEEGAYTVAEGPLNEVVTLRLEQPARLYPLTVEPRTAGNPIGAVINLFISGSDGSNCGILNWGEGREPIEVWMPEGKVKVALKATGYEDIELEIEHPMNVADSKLEPVLHPVMTRR